MTPLEPLTVACWKWKPQRGGYRSTFTAAHVKTLRSMVARHYQTPHRFVCVTDDPRGLEDVETIPLWEEWGNIQSPHGAHNPSCYRRLRVFSPAAAEIFPTPRVVSLDLDTVIVGDLAPLWDRVDDFVMWGETDPRSWYNGSMFLLRLGTRSNVYTDFQPGRSPAAAKSSGKFGSDQGWISYRLGRGQSTWSVRDGVYSWRVHIKPGGGKLPENARIVMFHGNEDPWHPEIFARHPWIREHYR